MKGVTKGPRALRVRELEELDRQVPTVDQFEKVPLKKAVRIRCAAVRTIGSRVVSDRNSVYFANTSY
ncbi:hypothetical protein D3C73_631780 [compost metagenome]